jgi:HD-GYP domain-containing protein (c-di-GMP phosphodiesterase class II)
MLRVPIASAIPGMVLAMPVLHPRRPDTVLLTAGLSIDERIIARLAEIRLSELWIRYPATEFIGEYVCPQVFEGQAAMAQQVANAFDAVLQDGDAQPRLDYSQYRTAVGDLLDRLLARPRAAIFIQEIADRDRPALRHSASVCMLSLLMGLKLDDYLITQRARLTAPTARHVSGLGVAAMLHDIGMLRIDPKIAEIFRKTGDESNPRWQAHVHIGFDMVKEAIGPAAAAAVLHHHQKFDGTGFPRRLRLDGSEQALAGEEIHIYARIVAAANIFDRLRYPVDDGNTPPVPAVRVLNRMRQEPVSNWLDPMVFKSLLNVAPAYAPGSIVQLSTGQQAVVGQWFPDDPCRPTVYLLDTAKPGHPRFHDKAQRIVLRDCVNVTIVRSEGQDVAADNFYPQHPGQYDLKLARRSLFNRADAFGPAAGAA